MSPKFDGLGLILILYSLTRLSCAQELADVPACFGLPQSDIYCYGDLLHYAQTAELYKDSKTFVDMNLKEDPDVVLLAFDNLEGDKNDSDVMRQFVEQYFEGPGNEFGDWIPADWKESPSFLNNIKDNNYRVWAEELNKLWKQLGRQIKEDVRDNPQRYTQIYVPQPFIIPGGRFRELYYWDSYWVVNGLLLSEMETTVKGMIENFIYLVDKLDLVPNANRIYQMRRSQPPFLIPIVHRYLEATNDWQYVQTLLPSLEKEYNFWMNNRSVVVEGHVLNRYDVLQGQPRPESYREDTATAEGLARDDAAILYSDIAAGAETGWGFSTRWFRDDTLKTIRTKQIVAVDLNSILCLNERLLAEFYDSAGNPTKSEEYRQRFMDRVSAFESLLWNEDEGMWFDYDLENNQRSDVFYASSTIPLWARCYGNGTGDPVKEQKVVNYLKVNGLVYFPGGYPTSLLESGEQWDFPNGWPPMQELLITGLDSTSLDEAKELAVSLAQNWTLTNWRGWYEEDVMFEKFDVRYQGAPGGGGEYDVQIGFGWSNAVVMELLTKYGDVLRSDDVSSDVTTVQAMCGTLLLSVITGFIFR
ncbi:trehalase-like [Glandiceps talaboti]